MKKERIQFSKNLRGYVVVTVRGTDISLEKSLDYEFKQKIEKMSYEEHLQPWKDAMKKLEEEAIAEAKSIFKAMYKHD